MKKVGIIGGSGYVAGELIRLLVNHPKVEIDFIYSHSQAADEVSSVHDDLLSYTELQFTDQFNPELDILFLCLGHGHSSAFLKEHQLAAHTKVIDLGNDFRLKKNASFQEKSFVYGLVEANKQAIQAAQYVANPGCFATAIQLALLPLAAAGELKNEVHIHALTGATGAGRQPNETGHFSWRNNNISVYKAFAHQHLDEIHETLSNLQSNFDRQLNFLPLRGDFTRGIFATLYTYTDLSEEELLALYEAYYSEVPFTLVSTKGVHLKQVVNTNNCFLQVQKIDGKLLITSVIDNLLKGAAGQAVQNMNLMFGWEESTGLQLKASYF